MSIRTCREAPGDDLQPEGPGTESGSNLYFLDSASGQPMHSRLRHREGGGFRNSALEIAEFSLRLISSAMRLG